MKEKIKRVLVKTSNELLKGTGSKAYIDGDYIKMKETHEKQHPTDPDRFDFSHLDYNEVTRKVTGETYWNGTDTEATEEEVSRWFAEQKWIPVTKETRWSVQELFHVPSKEHQGNWCFLCDGGTGWEWINPDSDYNYGSKDCWKFQERCIKNFEKAGLRMESYASWRYDLFKD